LRWQGDREATAGALAETVSGVRSSSGLPGAVCAGGDWKDDKSLGNVFCVCCLINGMSLVEAPTTVLGAQRGRLKRDLSLVGTPTTGKRGAATAAAMKKIIPVILQRSFFGD